MLIRWDRRQRNQASLLPDLRVLVRRPPDHRRGSLAAPVLRSRRAPGSIDMWLGPTQKPITQPQVLPEAVHPMIFVTHALPVNSRRAADHARRPVGGAACAGGRRRRTRCRSSPWMRPTTVTARHSDTVFDRDTWCSRVLEGQAFSERIPSLSTPHRVDRRAGDDANEIEGAESGDGSPGRPDAAVQASR